MDISKSWNTLSESDEFCLQQVKATSVIQLRHDNTFLLEESQSVSERGKLEEHARTH